jgi:hypothetical protein
MAEEGLGLQDAMDGAGRFHDELVDSFLVEVKNVSQLFPEESESVREELEQYVGALGNWVRACDQWSFEVRHPPLLPYFPPFRPLFFCPIFPVTIKHPLRY